MIRVLIVDDSATVRTLLRSIFESKDGFSIIGEACDGREAVKLTGLLHPDVITMDILMPNLDGFAATKEIMIMQPTPIVLISSQVTAMGEGDLAQKALQAGAVALLTKPPAPGDSLYESAVDKLIATVTAVAHIKLVRHWRADFSTQAAARKAAASGLEVLAIAASTGGPLALQQILSALPGDYPLPILIVQHIALGFTGGLSSWLNASTPLLVKLAEHHEVLRPQTVYFAPDNLHLTVSPDRRIALTSDPPVNGFRPSADTLFQSIARAYGAASICVILTGMGSDGVAGLRAIKRCGGRIFAQDEASSVVFGMPKVAIEERLAESALPPKELAQKLVSLLLK